MGISEFYESLTIENGGISYLADAIHILGCPYSSLAASNMSLEMLRYN